ncbi:MAG: hypothetical protein PHX50_11330, partial [Massilibacteroides sp.]|nr:hypothetical protein [Massilibacteroides sp.]
RIIFLLLNLRYFLCCYENSFFKFFTQAKIREDVKSFWFSSSRARPRNFPSQKSKRKNQYFFNDIFGVI